MHLFAYVAVVFVLWFVNVTVTPKVWWFYWVALSCTRLAAGIGTAVLSASAKAKTYVLIFDTGDELATDRFEPISGPADSRCSGTHTPRDVLAKNFGTSEEEMS